VLRALDPTGVRGWCAAVVEALAAHQQEIDDLNVYPVPDGDTGTNLALTAQAAATTLGSAEPPDAAGCLALLARGAVLGARGNSGVILSQILRGLADACPAGTLLDGAALAAGLERAAELAYAAVAEPVEGTILSVARAAALAAGAVRDADLCAVAEAAAQAATQAVARTPSQLPELARAGVVDAGGRGLAVVLEALRTVVSGRPGNLPAPRRVARDRQVLEAARETGSATYGYEVQYLLAATEDAVARLRLELAELGDSVVVVGTGDGLWNVHVHVNDVGAAVESGVEAGRPFRITVTRFADQHAAAGGPGADAAEPAAEPPHAGSAIVAMAPGEGLSHLFEAEGVVVVAGGPGEGSPSTGSVLAAIAGTGAARVVVLPNDGNLTAVAGAAAEQARSDGVRVAVVPSRSPVQGLAAVAVHDAARRFDDDVIAMAEAAAATRYAGITVAVRNAITMAGQCTAGDVLGLVEGDVVLIGQSVEAVSRELTDRLLVTGGELVTLIVGADAPAGLGEALERHLVATHPEVDVVVYDGGQPLYPLLLGVE